MHTQETTLKTLEHLWANYWLLGQQVDLDRMPPDRIDDLVRQNAPVNPLWLAAWLATQSFYLSTWSLWDYHSRRLCNDMPVRVSDKKKSHVQWVDETFTANSRSFAEAEWFSGGNALRNLIAHHAARVVGPDAEYWWPRAKAVFPELKTDPEQYILIDHENAATLMWKVEEFIRDPQRRAK